MASVRTVLSFATERRCAASACSSCVESQSKRLLTCLGRGTKNRVIAYLFRSASALSGPYTIVDVPLESKRRTRHILRKVLHATPGRMSNPPGPHAAFYGAPLETCALCMLPHGALFARLAKVARSTLCVCTYFCRKELILTPSIRDLATCLHRLSGGRVLSSAPKCRRTIIGLSPSCGFVVITSLKRAFSRPRGCIELVPTFFFHGRRFFHRFVLSTRFAYASKVMCPGIMLVCGNRSSSVS